MVQIIGRIYKIVSSECDGCYIGSTTQQLSRRFSVHKCHYRAYLAGKDQYYTSFEVLKFADASIELIHEGVFDNKQDLTQFEGEIIRTTPNAVNKNIAGRTRQEYLQQYQQDHAEQINTWRKTHNSCAICGGKYTNLGKAQHLRTKKHQNAVSSASSVIDSSGEDTDLS
jgi:hypothetical protein